MKASEIKSEHKLDDFQIGDRVVVLQDFDRAKAGMTGTIVTTSGMLLGVCFDHFFCGGHTLESDTGKHCKTGYGHWLLPSALDFIDQELHISALDFL